MMGSLKLAAPSWLPLEGLWTTRCVACDQSITGNSNVHIISRYDEYCPWCLTKIEAAEAEARREAQER